MYLYDWRSKSNFKCILDQKIHLPGAPINYIICPYITVNMVTQVTETVVAWLYPHFNLYSQPLLSFRLCKMKVAGEMKIHLKLGLLALLCSGSTSDWYFIRCYGDDEILRSSSLITWTSPTLWDSMKKGNWRHSVLILWGTEKISWKVMMAYWSWWPTHISEGSGQLPGKRRSTSNQHDMHQQGTDYLTNRELRMIYFWVLLLYN